MRRSGSIRVSSTLTPAGPRRALKHDVDRAIDDYSQIIHLEPKAVMAYESRGAGWREKKEYDKAIADFDEAIRLEPKNPGVYLARGDRRDSRQFDKALADPSPRWIDPEPRRLRDPRRHPDGPVRARQGDRRYSRVIQLDPRMPGPTATAAWRGSRSRTSTGRL